LGKRQFSFSQQANNQKAKSALTEEGFRSQENKPASQAEKNQFEELAQFHKRVCNKKVNPDQISIDYEAKAKLNQQAMSLGAVSESGEVFEEDKAIDFNISSHPISQKSSHSEVPAAPSDQQQTWTIDFNEGSFEKSQQIQNNSERGKIGFQIGKELGGKREGRGISRLDNFKFTNERRDEAVVCDISSVKTEICKFREKKNKQHKKEEHNMDKGKMKAISYLESFNCMSNPDLNLRMEKNKEVHGRMKQGNQGKNDCFSGEDNIQQGKNERKMCNLNNYQYAPQKSFFSAHPLIKNQNHF
jgi:hypothetical protein